MTESGSENGAVVLLGAAREEINPPMAGREVVCHVRSRALGVESDLCVRALVFGSPADDRPRAALAVLDTLYVHPEIVAAVREGAARLVPGLPPQSVMVASTHTHSAPPLKAFDMREHGWAGRIVLRRCGLTGVIAEPDPEWVEKVKKGAVRALARAWQARSPVCAGIGLTEARLGHNRRVVGSDGKATNVWTDPEGRHTGFFSPNVRFVVFRNAGDGRVRAILSGYGCHPVTLGPKNARPSPDYPGYLVRKLEAATGAELAVHVTTGGANINPRRCLSPTPELTQAMGEALADAVLASLDGTQPLRLALLAVAVAPMELALRAKLPIALTELLAGRLASPEQKTVRSEVQAIRLGDLVLVSAPGELFAELVVTVENISPLAHTLVVGHANDALGYLFTETAGREGGYEVEHGAASDSTEQPFLSAALRALDEVAKAS